MDRERVGSGLELDRLLLDVSEIGIGQVSSNSQCRWAFAPSESRPHENAKASSANVDCPVPLKIDSVFRAERSTATSEAGKLKPDEVGLLSTFLIPSTALHVRAFSQGRQETDREQSGSAKSHRNP